MTIGNDVFKCFWRSMKTVWRWRQKASHSRLEVQPRRRLDRRLFSVWNAGRPVCDSTQIGVAYVSHRQLPTASLSPGILVPCYCGSGTQERPDGTQYVLYAQPVQITQQRCNMVVFSVVAHQSYYAAALTTDCRRSCKRRDIPMRFTLP